MIHHINGAITFKTPTYIVVETGGVGYKINISLNTYARVEKLEKVKILTHFVVKEDSQTLYGFAEDVERSLFIHLISVSGVGPSTAQVILSSMTPEEARSAIIGDDEAAFRRVKGIGAKTAKRIILDLKDKLLKDAGDNPTLSIAGVDNTIRQEALMALVALGYARVPTQKALNKILREQPTLDNVETLIKLALREFSG